MSAFFIIFLLPAATPVCCWLIKAANRRQLINVAKLNTLQDCILRVCECVFVPMIVLQSLALVRRSDHLLQSDQLAFNFHLSRYITCCSLKAN